MQKNQKGFGHVGIIVIVIVLGLVGLSGWFVWNNNKTDDASNTGATKNDSSETNDDSQTETYDVPAGYELYKNTELGFKLTYPETWQRPQIAADANAALSAVLSDDTLDAGGDLKGAPQIFSAQAPQFEANMEYKGATLRPMTTNGNTVWEVKSAGLADVNVGSIYQPAPKIIYEKGDITVYDFPASHANSSWTTLVFRIKDKYIGVTSPVFNPPSQLSQEEFDARRADFNASLKQVAKSIREM